VPSRRAALALAAWAGVWCLSGEAAHAASQVSVALDYEVAANVAGCPDADDFRASVERQLRYAPFSPSAERRVAVQITRRENGYDGRIRWSDAGGRWVGDRRLSSKHADCDPIASSLAFAVAVQIQLLGSLAPPEPPPAPTPPAPPPGPVPPAISAETAAAEAARQAPAAKAAAKPARWAQLSAGVGPSLALAMAPQPTGLGRIFVSGRRGRVSLELGVDAALPVAERSLAGGGFSLDRFAAGAAACGHLRAFAACLTGTAGLLRARGFGVDAPASPAGPFSQVGARMVAAWDFEGRYFLAARVDLLVMVSPWTVTLNDVAVWTTPRVGALAGVDLGFRFF
jgi:hypothetical protein